MSRYFSNFPVIRYNGVQIRDITRRTNFIEQTLSTPLLFLPYTVKEGEKPEDIAHYYYGSVDYTWLVLMSNNITDPYLEWPLSNDDFHSFLMQKYAREDLKKYQIVHWCQNETITENIVFYYFDLNGEEEYEVELPWDESEDFQVFSSGPKPELSGTHILKTAPSTFGDGPLPLGWKPMRVYDYEYQLNENKREIHLVDKAHRDQIEREFKAIMRRT